MPDAALVEAIRRVLSDSPFHGEGYRKLWARLRHRGGVVAELGSGTFTPWVQGRRMAA